MSLVGDPILVKLLGKGGGFLPDCGQILGPGIGCFDIPLGGWQRVALHAQVEHKPGHGTQIIGQKIPVALVKLDEPLPHREVMIPAPELDRSAGQGVVAFNDGRIERDDDRGMNEVKQVGCGWPQALDALGFERADRLEHVGLLGAAITRMQQPSKGTLIVPIFVDIRNPQFGLPQERMVGPLEDLTLLGNRGHDRLEG